MSVKKVEKKKRRVKFKSEHIAYIVLGVMVAAIIALVVVIYVTTSGAGSGTAIAPCCR